MMLRPIDLRALATSPTRKVELVIDQPLAGFESLTPVQGELQVIHRGDFLEVRGTARTIVTLSCDRCLKRFNHRLQTDFEEVIWLSDGEEELPLELEVTAANLDESIPRDGKLDPLDLVYQHLCLELPTRNLCDADCQGVALKDADAQSTDQRWSALTQLLTQLELSDPERG
ncbi:YceD family protein [Gloeobacter kilaueensis]|uniref:Metal-binding protein n=1 Tax=Gloeobacter kilaueensis (strain ATCC BAA-2537 / CCAP 1431/1 / ULC 316 / JS1) TaxID=1183438 RepID=U5QFM2_GLOK1|nr:DUF177 domain-containing protein [Gloeobacter kilaueensis]AGY57767.1 hypothetical protein GKIL_1521 [Gloeobacter kilaueensis JS1]